MNLEKKNCFKIFIIIFILISHFLFLNFNSVNHEYLSYDLLKYMDLKQINLFELLNDDENKYYLNNYFNQQANTFGITIFIFFLSKIFFIDYLIAGKILSTLGLILFFIGLERLLKIKKEKYNIYFVIIIILNPVIWAFSYRAYGDILAAGLSIFAFSNLINLKIKNNNIIFYFILGISIIIKPFYGIYLIALNLFFYFNKIKSKKIIIANILTGFIPLIYFATNFYFFKFFLFPDYGAVEKHDVFTIKFFIIQFILYSGTLFMILFPLWFLRLIIKIKKIEFISILFLILIYFFFKENILIVFNNGELNLGPISLFLNSNYLIILLFILSAFFLLALKHFLTIKKDNFNKTILYTIIIYLIILSFLKPVQKYLIPIIPLCYILINNFFTNKDNTVYFKFIIPFFLLINFFLLSNQYLNGEISNITYKSLKKKNIYLVTNTNIIDPHQTFLLDGKTKMTNNNIKYKYQLTNDFKNKKCIKYFKTKLIFLKKELCLIKK
jgi:hypothetical protein